MPSGSASAASSGGDFVHLHVHTEYSMLDGAARLDDLFRRTSELGMGAIAMTDHGNVFGAYDFYSKATAAGIKPIIGLEAYLTPNTSRYDKKRVRWNDGGDDDVSGSGAYTHMTLLAESTAGMHNLFRLSSRASMEGYYYQPRADRELLSEYADGLIGTTGCPSGEVQTWLRIGDYAKARASAAEFQDILGKDSYFIELMDHDLAIEKRVRDGLLQLSRDLAIPVIATNDSHYVRREDAPAHEHLLCVSSGSVMSDPKRFKLDGDGYYIKSAAEMRELWEGKHGLKEACDNTLLIAERCEVSFTEGEGRYMPRFPCPAGEDETSWFVKEVERGLHERYPKGISADVRARADFETEVIIGKGYPGYFLVVADFMKWAKGNGIRTGVRGSGAGSMCAYALSITDLDPLEYKLTFERFLNPERKSMPDFDVDFDERRRGEVIRYVTEKYGEDRVSMIVTYGTIKAKQAVKDASRILGYPFAMGDRITKAMPAAVMGKDIPLKEIFDSEHRRYGEGGEFRSLYDNDHDVKTVVDTAMGLEGLKRQWGVHAAGVIMSSEPLLDILPLIRRPQDGAIITQFDYPTCEQLGLVKMDFLGLRNLTVLGDAVQNVKRSQGVDLDLDRLGADPTDPATYELLSRGDTLGVFQLDGGGTRQLLRLMRPESIQDIMATIALYRPGPMGIDSHTNYALRRSGQQAVVYPHPEVAQALVPVLESNYGLIVYQEDVIEVARLLAGYTLGRADMLRRAMGKKKKEVLDAEYVPFESGMKERGFSPAAIKAVWDALLPFADYGFGKAHAAAYAQVSYWTAYLKANYPAEYMAAVLTSVKDDKDKMAIYLNECRRMKIQVLPPDVNESDATFTPVGSDIRFGLTAIRNVGANVVDKIVEARAEQGRYEHFNDFLDKVDPLVCNKRVIDSLVKAGAFDDLKHKRRALVAIHEQAVDRYSSIKKDAGGGQDSLFDDLMGGDAPPIFDLAVAVPDIDEWDKMTLLGHEREMLGLYVSDHPLMGLEHVLQGASDCSIGQLVLDEERPENSPITVTGLITSVQRKITRKGDSWAVVTIEDLDGAIDVLLFPGTYQLAGSLLAEDAIVTVKGKLSRSKDQPEIRAEEVTLPDLEDGPAGPVVVSLPVTRCTPPVVEQLKEVLRTHPGVTEVHLRLHSREDTKVLKVGDNFRVAAGAPLYADLKHLLGPGCLSG